MSSSSSMEDNVVDLQNIRQQHATVENENLDATRRMLQLCEVSEKAGGKTIENLVRQGEQLNRVEEDLNAIDREMKDAKKNLTEMERLCGICSCPCGKSKKKKDEGEWGGKKKGGVINSQPKSSGPNKAGPNRANQATPQSTNDPPQQPKKETTNDNMLQVNMMVGNLRNMALDMGTVIDTQNTQLDRINLRALQNTQNIEDVTGRVQKLLDD